MQAAGASSLAPSLRAGTRIELPHVDTIADGLATKSVGAQPFAIIQSAVDLAVEVTDGEIAAAVLLLLERAKTVVEGAGAVGLAACLAGRLPRSASKVAVIISGGNIDMNLLDRIINLGLIQEGRLFRFSTRLPDRPGELQRLVACIAACRANIHQIRHERAHPGLPLTQATVILELETRGREHINQIEQALSAAGFVIEATADRSQCWCSRRRHRMRPAAGSAKPCPSATAVGTSAAAKASGGRAPVVPEKRVERFGVQQRIGVEKSWDAEQRAEDARNTGAPLPVATGIGSCATGRFRSCHGDRADGRRGAVLVALCVARAEANRRCFAPAGTTAASAGSAGSRRRP